MARASCWARLPPSSNHHNGRSEPTFAAGEQSGHLRMGDSGARDASLLSERERTCTRVIRSGEKEISPRAEGLIETHRDVAQVAVVRLPPVVEETLWRRLSHSPSEMNSKASKLGERLTESYRWPIAAAFPVTWLTNAEVQVG